MRADSMSTLVGYCLAGLSLISGQAAAADLGVPRDYASDRGPLAPRFDFNGRYFGVQAGYGSTGVQSSATWGATGGPTEDFSYRATGAVGGAHLGFGWHERGLLFGLEADLEGANISGTGKGNYGAVHATTVDWMGSLRARMGWVSGSTLFYATGGLAYAGVKVEELTARGIAPYASDNQWKAGWTVGGGIEHAVTSRVSLRLEYRYTDLGKLSFYDPALDMREVNDLTTHAVRAGLSFRF